MVIDMSNKTKRETFYWNGCKIKWIVTDFRPTGWGWQVWIWKNGHKTYEEGYADTLREAKNDIEKEIKRVCKQKQKRKSKHNTARRTHKRRKK